MIEAYPIGRFVKTHGIQGELTVESPELDAEGLLECRFVVAAIDGINVPFFIERARQKGPDTVLLKLEGIDSDTQGRLLCGRDMMIESSLELIDDTTAADGDDPDSPQELNALALTGFTATLPDGSPLGRIARIDTSTPNALFVIDRADAAGAPAPLPPLLVPVALGVAAVDIAARTVALDLPEGLIESQQ